MDLLPSDDQREIVDAVRDVLAASGVPPTASGGLPPDDAVWSGLSELGLFGIAVPEEQGGLGLGLAEQVLVFAEFGRFLTAGPLVATTVSAQIAAAAGDDELAGALISGEARVAWAEARDPGAVVGPSVSGRFRVFDPESEWVLFASPGAVALVPSEGLGLRAPEPADPGAPVAFVELDGVEARSVGEDARWWWLASTLVAAMHSGIAAATRDMSAAYAKTREQYGKPIGQFQAVKHRCADMAARAEQAHFQTVYAALSSAEAPDVLQITSARTVAATAATQNAADNIVNHGGMGFSHETGAYHFVRRAQSLSYLAGSTRWNLEALAAVDDAKW
ncbi:acyl-CoA dehydrogenase family protein [Microbacterium sp. No. 7]|uniref:acyl-CoA dehydrogenase family protein n=1 Tax=Microbacterium sp. No. 7 TaxID=1714373 RepID=UPI0006D2B8BE|nr:acyl-CoA dehydrogenase family protein [Microbacterium sp. No. 7]